MLEHRERPRRRAVDLFEDQNGFAATGRDIAMDQPATGCFDVPTAGLEPGKHWVYGVVHAGDTPLSARYWPIGIVVRDPGRAAAPKRLRAKRTLDGATVTWKKVAGVSGYVVTATPVNPQDAPVSKVTVPILAKPQATLSLRGAERWRVSVQSVGLDDRSATSPRRSSPARRPRSCSRASQRHPAGRKGVGLPARARRTSSSLKLLAAPKGTKLNRRTGLLTWTPTAGPAGSPRRRCGSRPAAAGRRCITQEWFLSAYAPGFAPAGPARGFRVLDSVVKPGETIELRAQGIDEGVRVKVDGRRVTARVLDQQTVSVTLPEAPGDRPARHLPAHRTGPGGDPERSRRRAEVGSTGRWRAPRGPCARSAERQHHLEAGVPGLGLEPQLAAVPDDDPLGDVEAEAGALADRLRREEGVEDARAARRGCPGRRRRSRRDAIAAGRACAG